jgi:hypothetical protein
MAISYQPGWRWRISWRAKPAIAASGGNISAGQYIQYRKAKAASMAENNLKMKISANGVSVMA